MPRHPIDREIAVIALPAALALATDPLYDLTDTAILGHLGSAQLAGAALATRILAFGYSVFVFLMFGTTAAVARRYGAGRDRDAVEHGVAAVWLAAGIGVVAAGLTLVVGRPAIGWFGGHGAVARHAWTYLSASVAGLPAFTIVLAGVGFLRGRRDTRTPLVITAVTVTVNIVLEVALVYGARWGVAASALGTVFAKWLGAAAYLALLGREVHRTDASWRPRADALRGHLVVGRDLVVRTFLLIGVLTAAQSWATRIGVAQAAAYAIAFQLWMLAAYAVDGLEAAAQSLVAHRLGAGLDHEVAEVVRRVLRWGLVIGIGSGVVLAATSSLLPHVFTGDAAVVTLATASLWWVAAMQPVNGAAFAVDGILVGAGRQRALAAAMAIAAAVFVVADVALRDADTLHAVWLAITAFMLTRAAAGLAFVHSAKSPTDASGGSTGAPSNLGEIR